MLLTGCSFLKIRTVFVSGGGGIVSVEVDDTRAANIPVAGPQLGDPLTWKWLPYVLWLTVVLWKIKMVGQLKLNISSGTNASDVDTRCRPEGQSSYNQRVSLIIPARRSFALD